MKIFIVGSTGMLGSECRKVLSGDHEVFCPERKEVNIANWDVVIESLTEVSPDVILNCVGFTDMEASEKEDFDVRKINVEGPRNLAQASARFGCKMVHISCGHIFDGQKPIPQPYFEDDPPNPMSAYGKSKLESETAVRGNSPNYIIVRSMCLYGLTGKNLIKSILAKALARRSKVLQVPKDQFGAPTWSYRLALQLKELVENNGRGTYHATASGCCSRFQFVEHVLNRLEIKTPVEPCRLKDLKQTVDYPANCLLENRLAKKQGVDVMVDWKEDLDRFLEASGDELIKEARKR
ncbi:MAG: dTDP-4-dehydrorhamnose reductase [Thermodesulfobacteriota bacterium]|nr:dTDP-4-dehydrorhamnose reductase [Thermodesulfobacteriota bacterium]